MSEKKPKPPRPPAPNISKIKPKRPLTAATISFKNSPLSADSDDELSDDDQRLSIFTNNSHSSTSSKPDSIGFKISKSPSVPAGINATSAQDSKSFDSSRDAKSGVETVKPKTLTGNDTKGSLSSKELEDLIDSFGDSTTTATTQKKNKKKPALNSKPASFEERTPSVEKAPSLDSRTPSVDEKSSLGERTSSAGSLNEIKEEPKAVNKSVEKVRQQHVNSAPVINSSKVQASEKPPKPVQRPLKPARSLSGLVTVSNEVLKEEDGGPELPKDSMTDPLSFLDKFMDDDDEDEFVPVRSQQKKLFAPNHRTKSLDSEKTNSLDHAESEPLNIDQFHYSIPTPSEIKDEPLRSQSDPQYLSRTPPDMTLSLSGLLASSTHHDEHVTTIESKQPPRDDSPPSNSSDFVKREPDSDRELSDIGDIYSPSTPKSPESADEKDVVDSPTAEVLNLDYSPPGLFLTVASFFIFAILVFPLPALMTGFFAGMAFAFYLILFVVWLSVPQLEREYRELEDPNTLPPLQIPGPKMTASKVRVKEQGNLLHKVGSFLGTS